MEKILVSACLIGQPVRYNGEHKRSASVVLQRWMTEGRVITVCPEVAGGLTVPRPPAEILGGAGGAAVLSRRARVINPAGNELTAAFISGANHALGQVRAKGIRIAVLKSDSPSCGNQFIYDGTFSATRVPGQGVTAALLASAGVRVFNEHQFDEASDWLDTLET